MSKIEWCDKTINPIVGCTKISAGCENCYAEKMARRLKAMGMPQYQDVVDKNGWTGEICGTTDCFHTLPQKPKKIFVCSMGDLFHENLSDGSRAMVFYLMRDRPQHTYLILTKRPGRMKFFLERKINPKCIDAIPNLWLGVTVENQEQADKRIPILLQIPAKVRFVSVEPMLEQINLTELEDNEGFYNCLTGTGVNVFHQSKCVGEKIDWVICGAETGQGKRQMKIEWAEYLMDQCKQAGTPYFFKKDSNGQYPDNMTRGFPVWISI